MDRADHDGVCVRAINYSPLPSQRKFHSSPARFKGFSGPIGSGKSQALCHEAIKLTYLNPGRTGLLGAPTYPMLRDSTQASLFEVLTANKIPHEYNRGENILTMTDTGSRVIFRPVDDFERLRGTNLAWFGLDELSYAPQEAWLRLEGRLRDPKAKRLCGFAVWTPKGFDWVYQKFISDSATGYEVTLAKPFENRFLLKQIPDFYERLKTSYDPSFYQQEVLGAYLSLQGGKVYNMFHRDDNVQKLTVDQNLPLLWALDFNVDPMSSVVVQIWRGKVYVLDEIVLHRASTRDACQEFIRRFPEHAGKVVIYGDASGNNTHTTGQSDYQIIREFFDENALGRPTMKVPRANPAVRERINLVNSKLKNAAGEIELIVDGKCKELIKDFEQVSYKENTVEPDKDKDRKRTHLSDALGYLIWQECRARRSVGEKGCRLIA